jgi:hypothetical protein
MFIQPFIVDVFNVVELGRTTDIDTPHALRASIRGNLLSSMLD